MIFLIWSIVLVTALVLYLRQVYTIFSRRGVKTQTVIPVIGNMANVLLKRDHFIDALNKAYEAFPGEKFTGQFEFVKPILLIHDLELIKKITVKDFEHFLDHRFSISEDIEPMFGRNLLALKGQEWKDMRSTLSPAFTSSKIRLMVPFMVDVGDQMVLNMKKEIKESKDGYIDVEVRDLTTRYANDVIASCAFGLKVDSQSDRDNQFYTQCLAVTTFKFKQLIYIFLLSAFPIMAKLSIFQVFPKTCTSFFNKLVLDTIKHREESNSIRPDMIHLLIKAKKGQLSHDEKTTDADHAGFSTVKEFSVGKSNVKKVWSDNDLVAQAMFFLFAGFDSVSSAMVFLLYELALNPEVQDKLYKEIKDNDVKNGGKLDYTSIQNMTYMDMVVSEVLRLWPPAIALDRLCIKPYNIGKPNEKATEDFIIPKGMGVMMLTYCIHRDPRYFPNPEKFDPERFSEENKHKFNSSAYMPFGLGPRNCIGSRFALCEVKVMVYQLLSHFEVIPGPKTIVPVEFDKDALGVKMKGGHWLRFRNRKQHCH